MSRVHRREFLRRVARAGGGALFAPSLAGLAAWNGATPAQARAAAAGRAGRALQRGYGELVPSESCPEFWIPRRFHCVRLSEALAPSRVRPDLMLPNGFDGMATFALPDGGIRLIRNHEMTDPATIAKPIGPNPYDGRAAGGTTSLEVRIRGAGDELQIDVVDEFVSLSGTHVNCAGGPTPWDSWLSCEETTNGAARGFEREHGYIFEVPAAATGAVEPVPLRAMGRMVHEAIAVDPRTGIVYETEDVRHVPGDDSQPGSGFYRFLPARPGRLEEGGRLQILVVRGRPHHGTTRGQTPWQVLPCTWVDIEDPDPSNAGADPSAVFREGLSKGAAIFQRLEGCFYGDDSIYFVSTSGGDARAGQVWQYRPTGDDEGELVLVFESPSRDVLDSPDNICIGPRDTLVICEDGVRDQYIRALTREGDMFDLVRAPHAPGTQQPGEFAGSCLSPDGRVLFFNVQGATRSTARRPSRTYALWGPW
jgi:secreted PhoX family phosphatase